MEMAKGKTPTDAKLDAAIAAAAAPPGAGLKVQLPRGREALVQFPIPIDPQDVLAIVNALTTFFLQQYAAEHGKPSILARA